MRSLVGVEEAREDWGRGGEAREGEGGRLEKEEEGREGRVETAAKEGEREPTEREESSGGSEEEVEEEEEVELEEEEVELEEEEEEEEERKGLVAEGPITKAKSPIPKFGIICTSFLVKIVEQ